MLRLVINCRLHQIDGDVMRELAPRATPPLDGQSRWDDNLLGRPKDREDLAVRISLFWEVRLYLLSKASHVLTGTIVFLHRQGLEDCHRCSTNIRR